MFKSQKSEINFSSPIDVQFWPYVNILQPFDSYGEKMDCGFYVCYVLDVVTQRKEIKLAGVDLSRRSSSPILIVWQI